MGDVLCGAACKLLAEEKTLAEPVAPWEEHSPRRVAPGGKVGMTTACASLVVRIDWLLRFGGLLLLLTLV